MWGRKGRGLFHTIRHRNLVNTQSIPGKHFQEGSSTLPHRHISLPDPQISPGSLLNPISCNSYFHILTPEMTYCSVWASPTGWNFLAKTTVQRKSDLGRGIALKMTEGEKVTYCSCRQGTDSAPHIMTQRAALVGRERKSQWIPQTFLFQWSIKQTIPLCTASTGFIPRDPGIFSSLLMDRVTGTFYFTNRSPEARVQRFLVNR